MADTYFEVPRGTGALRAESLNRAARSGPAEPRPPAGQRLPRIEYLPFPPTSLPHRDLLVLEQISIRPDDRVCEVGVGSGATAARVARLGPSEVVGVDVSAGAIEAVRDLEARHENLRLEVADVTKRETIERLASRFDVVFSCDTLEHVDDPPGYFRAIRELLAPGGRCFITFPNEPPEIMHGVTRFASVGELEEAVRGAGLRDVELGAARLTPRAAKLVDVLGWRPLGVVRKGVQAIQRLRGGGAGARAQRFEETSFHRHRRVWRALSPAVNLYWYALLRMMARGGRAFDIDWEFCRTPFEDCQVVIRGIKPPDPRSAHH